MYVLVRCDCAALPWEWEVDREDWRGGEGRGTSAGEFNFNLGAKHLRCACQAFSICIYFCAACANLLLFVQGRRDSRSDGQKPRAFEYAICNLT